MDFKTVGSFTVSGYKIRCTDPCYSKVDTWCAGNVNAKAGVWKAYAAFKDFGPGNWNGLRCTHLLVVHESFEKKNVVLKGTGIHGGVDSGQFGFFDLKKFPFEDRNHESRKTFYDKVCGLTSTPIRVPDPGWPRRLEFYKEKYPESYETMAKEPVPTIPSSDPAAGVLEFGAVSSSGFGDGGYPIYAMSEAGNAVVLLAEYVSEKEAEDEEKEAEDNDGYELAVILP